MRDSFFYDMSPSSLSLPLASEITPIFSSFVGRLWVCFWGRNQLVKFGGERDEGRRSARFSKLFVIAVSPPPDFSIEKRILSIVGLLHQQGEEGEGAWEKGGGGGVAD